MGLALRPQEIFCLEGLDGLKNKKIKKKPERELITYNQVTEPILDVL